MFVEMCGGKGFLESYLNAGRMARVSRVGGRVLVFPRKIRLFRGINCLLDSILLDCHVITVRSG